MTIQTQKIDDILPLELAEKMEDLSKRVGFSYGWYSNPTSGIPHWNHDFGRMISSNGLDISSTLAPELQETWTHLKNTYQPDMNLIRCYINQHTYGTEGYPHIDGFRKDSGSFVIYLNRDWTPDMAGETIIFDGDDVELASLPKFNRGVVFPGNKLHAARAVSRKCNTVRVTLMFKFAKPDIYRDNIQRFLNMVGAEKKSHSGRTLSDHLLGTYDLLKAANMKQDICNAGGVHSIFGTQSYRDVTVPLSEKNRLIAVVGQKAADLAEMFSKIKRWNSPLHSDDFKELGVIQLANLKEQNALRDPKLDGLWNDLNK